MSRQTFIPAHEMEGVRQRAKERAIKKVEEREHLRLEIQGRKLLEEMQESALLLMFGYEPHPMEPDTLIPLTRDRIASAKAGADIASKLLNKILPDLRQIELSESPESKEGRILDDADLDNRARLYIEALQKRGVVVPINREAATEAEFTEESNLDFLK